ncbi:hypothetical protein, partial [Enterobacter asburiae]
MRSVRADALTHSHYPMVMEQTQKKPTEVVVLVLKKNPKNIPQPLGKILDCRVGPEKSQIGDVINRGGGPLIQV